MTAQKTKNKNMNTIAVLDIDDNPIDITVSPIDITEEYALYQVASLYPGRRPAKAIRFTPHETMDIIIDTPEFESHPSKMELMIKISIAQMMTGDSPLFATLGLISRMPDKELRYKFIDMMFRNEMERGLRGSARIRSFNPMDRINGLIGFFACMLTGTDCLKYLCDTYGTSISSVLDAMSKTKEEKSSPHS